MRKTLYLAPHTTCAQLQNYIAECGIDETLSFYGERVSNRKRKGWRKVEIALVVRPFRKHRIYS